ncbi:MAG: serine/threonine protein kinase [Verrucomicrobia bacterium]|nr:serine/threonine protein kinase [Verrucomicrobiota bacterium]
MNVHGKLPELDRRRFIQSLLCGAASSAAISCRHLPEPEEYQSGAPIQRLLFVSNGRSYIMNSDGSGPGRFDFDMPNQVTWQPSAFFPDGRRILFLSMEERRDGPGRPFETFYTQTPTHLWVYDLETESLWEVANRDRMSVFYTPALILNEGRLLVQVVRDGVGQLFTMNLDGTEARPFTQPGEGLPYGCNLAPDGQRIAFHLASPSGYQIWTSDLEGGSRTLIAGDPDQLYFGPVWSPDSQWLTYQACRYREDPGHDWADVCVNRADGSDPRFLTQGQAHWFGATYGGPEQRGGGSNMLSWTLDGSILFSRKLPGSKVPWEYQANRPDTDHFNRDYKPELAVGGTEICRLNPATGKITQLSAGGPGVWDCRATESPDANQIVFCRAGTGHMPGIWSMKPNGSEAHLLTPSFAEHGADHPRWLPLRK